MALKFLNKKGWHTGSLRNIENVWKAEQKHDAEQRKLEELRKQIHEERERDEFRVLQEQAGLTPRQERLEFLYDSGLSVGKPSSEGFKALETQPSADNSASAAAAAASSSSTQSATPGALFEDKPQSANDAWRKLHSDPLLMIRQREQEALARIKNNPVKMAMIRKSVESKKKPEESHDEECQKVKSKHKKHSSKHHSGSESDSHEERERKRKAKHRRKEHQSDTESDFSEQRERKRKVEKKKRDHVDSDEDSRDRSRYHRHSHRDYDEKPQRSSSGKQISDRSKDSERTLRGKEKSRQDYDLESNNDRSVQRAIDNGRSNQANDSKHNALPPRQDSHRRRGRAPQLSEEERAARLREMQMDAEVHEEQRWKRLKKADEDDAREARQAGHSQGRSFLHSVQKTVFGAEKGGSSTIEESVRRRSHYLQGRTADEGNAFRR